MGRRAAGHPTVLMTLVSRPVMAVTKLMQRLEPRGLENLPTTGPLIIAANHTQYLDPLIIGTAMVDHGISPSFVAKKELFRGVLGLFLRNMGQISVDRRRPDGVLEAMAEALDEGKCIVIFPEGTFTSDPNGWPMTPKTGVVRLSEMRPDVPVIPVAHWGNERLIHPVTCAPSWKRLVTRSERAIVSFLPAHTWSGQTRQEKATGLMVEIAREVAQIRTDLGRPAGEAPTELAAWTMLPNRRQAKQTGMPELYGA